MLDAFPDEPAPPSSDVFFVTDRGKAVAFDKAIRDYLAGLKNALGLLRSFVSNAEQVLRKTDVRLEKGPRLREGPRARPHAGALSSVPAACPSGPAPVPYTESGSPDDGPEKIQRVPSGSTAR